MLQNVTLNSLSCTKYHKLQGLSVLDRLKIWVNTAKGPFENELTGSIMCGPKAGQRVCVLMRMNGGAGI